MKPSTPRDILLDRLRLALRCILQLDAIELLTKFLDIRDVLHYLWDKTRYRGMYEILDYDATLEIIDPNGECWQCRCRQPYRHATCAAPCRSMTTTGTQAGNRRDTSARQRAPTACSSGSTQMAVTDTPIPYCPR
jgi:hypothetical protein